MAFHTTAGGLVTVMLRALNRQGHLGISDTVLIEIRAQCLEAAENNLTINLILLVL